YEIVVRVGVASNADFRLRTYGQGRPTYQHCIWKARKSRNQNLSRELRELREWAARPHSRNSRNSRLKILACARERSASVRWRCPAIHRLKNLWHEERHHAVQAHVRDVDFLVFGIQGDGKGFLQPRLLSGDRPFRRDVSVIV